MKDLVAARSLAWLVLSMCIFPRLCLPRKLCMTIWKNSWLVEENSGFETLWTWAREEPRLNCACFCYSGSSTHLSLHTVVNAYSVSSPNECLRGSYPVTKTVPDHGHNAPPMKPLTLRQLQYLTKETSKLCDSWLWVTRDFGPPLTKYTNKCTVAAIKSACGHTPRLLARQDGRRFFL